MQFGACEHKQRHFMGNKYKILMSLSTYCCRHGVLMEEGHTTSFTIMTNLMDKEADNFGTMF